MVGGQSEDFHREHDKWDLKRGFKLGYTAGRRKNVQRYTFFVRKMRITVWADKAGTARRMAQQEAEKRFHAAGLQPPKSGWTLRLLGSDSP